jgi:hypothetical protein
MALFDVFPQSAVAIESSLACGVNTLLRHPMNARLGGNHSKALNPFF